MTAVCRQIQLFPRQHRGAMEQTLFFCWDGRFLAKRQSTNQNLRKLEVPTISDRQRQLKTDPLIGNIASLKLTHPWRLSVGSHASEFWNGSGNPFKT